MKTLSNALFFSHSSSHSIKFIPSTSKVFITLNKLYNLQYNQNSTSTGNHTSTHLTVLRASWNLMDLWLDLVTAWKRVIMRGLTLQIGTIY